MRKGFALDVVQPSFLIMNAVPVLKARRLAKVIGIGILGLGKAARLNIPAVLAHPSVDLVAGADIDADVRRAFVEQLERPAVSNAAELCERPDVDAVWVTTPHQHHRGHAELAVRSGKHVIVEKPMALTLDDCDAMVSAAERAGVVLLIGHTEGYAPFLGVMRDIIESGTIGDLRMIATWNYDEFLYRRRRPEELRTDTGGGIVFNAVPHHVEIFRALTLCEVASVVATTGAWDPARPTEGACSAQLLFADGTVASLVYNGYDHFDSRELQRWRADDDPVFVPPGSTRSQTLSSTSAPSAFEFTADAPRSGRVPFGVTVVSCTRGDMQPWAEGGSVMVYGEDGRREVTVPPSNGVPGRAEVIDELCGAVEGKSPPRHDGVWGRHTLAACLAVLESSRARREVFIEEML